MLFGARKKRKVKKFMLGVATICCTASFCFAPSAYATTSHSKKTVKHHAQKKHTSKHIASKKSTKTHLAKNKNNSHHLALTSGTRANVNPELLNLQAEVPPPSSGLFTSIEQRLVGFVHKTIATIRYSVYKLGGSHFDSQKGVYVVDCSSYVDNILQEVYPQAFSSLARWSGSIKPTSHDYYHFFTEGPKRYWDSVSDVEDLRPGDILVFRYQNRHGGESGGHVMIVMNKPTKDADTYLIRVSDSASAGHSQDTRPPHVSGIGIGTLLLKVNPKTFQPSAYAWKVGSQWKNNVNFAMGRPLGLS